LGLVLALVAYWLIDLSRVDGALISISFLILLPTVLSMFVAYVADPTGEQPIDYYLGVALQFMVAGFVVSVFVLREGAVCIMMLGPLWIGSGLGGAGIAYQLRRRVRRGRTYCTALLLLPVACFEIEPLFPKPVERAVVTRSVVVDAPPSRIWPLLRGISDVASGEGRWNLTQDVVGVPRPVSAHLIGDGVGAQRLAVWGHGIRFREEITEWSLNERMGWRFIFDDANGWAFTDPHLRPGNPYMRITTGGYRVTPTADGRTRVELHTEYWAETPVNAYARIWGEVFLGDLESNILAVVKARAERPHSATQGA
jgi:hypothetical protein